MCNNFTERVGEYNFRDQNAVLLPNFNSVKYGRKSFRCYGAHVWNNVPSHMKRCAPTLNGFKDLIRSRSGIVFMRFT